jgi:hypothetical protein
MKMHRFATRRSLMVAAVAALVPLTQAHADANPEVASFYTLDRDLGSAAGVSVRGAQGPIHADASSVGTAGAWQAANPEAGSFYMAQDFGLVEGMNARGAAGPIRSDGPADAPYASWHATNPEAGSFYNQGSNL